jgi:hypothetical protein
MTVPHGCISCEEVEQSLFNSFRMSLRQDFSNLLTVSTVESQSTFAHGGAAPIDMPFAVCLLGSGHGYGIITESFKCDVGHSV